MRRDEAFLLGAMAGVLIVWRWGPKLVRRIDEEPRRVRTPAASGIQVEATAT